MRLCFFSRKATSCVMAVFLMLGVMISAPDAYAAQEKTASAGGTVRYSVSIDESKALAGFRIFMEYDTDAFSLEKVSDEFVVEQGSFSSGGTLIPNTTETGCQVMWYNTSNVTVSGTMFTVTLRVAPDAEQKAYPVTLSVSADDTVDSSGTPVAISVEGSEGTITVDGAGKAAVTVGQVIAYPGDTVRLPVDIENNPGFAGFSFAVTHNAKTALSSFSAGALIANNTAGTLTPNAAAGNVNWTSPTVTRDNGELLLLEFKIADDCRDGDYPVNISLIDGNENNFVNLDMEPLAVEFEAGNIKVYEYMPGDVNMDGEITPFDLVCMARHIVELETLTGKKLLAADVDKDGSITSADCVKLAKYLVELIDTLE